MFLPSGPYVTYQRFITKNEYNVMNKTSSTRSYVFSLCESDLLKWAWFNETIGMILEWFIQTGFVNCIASSQRSGSKNWFARGAYMEFNQQVPLALRPHPNPRPRRWCHSVLTAGGAAVTGSSSLRANRDRAKRTPAACVHGLWEDLTAALRSSTASQALEHTLRPAKN